MNGRKNWVCPACFNHGWVPWGTRVSETAHLAAIRMLICCQACNEDREIPIPSLAESLAILDQK